MYIHLSLDLELEYRRESQSYIIVKLLPLALKKVMWRGNFKNKIFSEGILNISDFAKAFDAKYLQRSLCKTFAFKNNYDASNTILIRFFTNSSVNLTIEIKGFPKLSGCA